MWIRRVFRAPELKDPEAARLARALTPVSWIFIAAAAGAIAASQLLEIPRASPGTSLIALGAAVMSLVLSHRGRPALGAASLLGLSWLVLTSRAGSVGGVGPELAGAFMVLVLAAGVLLGPRGAIVAMVGSAAVPLGVLAFAPQPPPYAAPLAGEIARSAVTSMLLLAGGGLSLLTALRARRSLADTERQASELAGRERELAESQARYRALLERLPAGRRARLASACAGLADAAEAGQGAILVVDDEPIVRRVARRMLERAGWTVLEAAGGREALERLREACDEIRCVLLDRVMPEMDGERTFRAMRALRRDLPVLFVSGEPDPELRLRLADQEALAFVDKPFRLSDLERHLRSLGTCS